jgi:hypothetical protein
MWLLTTQGFYSVVAHRDHPEMLLVRAQTRDDIEALRNQIPDLAPYEDPNADYRWRAEVTREQWVEALEQLGGAIDYPNFKNPVADVQGPEREGLYHQVWQALRRLKGADRVAAPTALPNLQAPGSATRTASFTSASRGRVTTA